jgi:hypothetical protein
VPVIVPFPAGPPTAKFLIARLRELSADTANIVFDHPHFKERLALRELSIRHAIETLRKGEAVGNPTQDQWGDWRIKVTRLVAGRRVQVVVAYKGDHFVAVTIF